MKTSVQVVVCTVLVAGLVLLPAGEVFADCETCTPSFTKIPDYIVSGDGTCVHKGIGPDGGDPSDVLEVDIPDNAKCHDCCVEVTAEWMDNGMPMMESKAKGGAGKTHMGNPPYWPHTV